VRSIVRHITRKSRGGFTIRDDIADAEILVAGRGNDCAIHLPDPRILLRHAEISLRGDSLYVTAMPGADVRINGNLSHVARFGPLDVLRLGPYEIKLQTGMDGASTEDSEQFDSHAMILTVELVEPMGDDLQQLVTRSRIEITRIGLPIRTWSWLLALLAAFLFFLVPFTLNLFHVTPETHLLTRAHEQPKAAPTGVWTSGAVSSPHRFFGAACETCHEIPFIPVRDQACLNCHDGIESHAMEARFPGASFRTNTCSDCHKEHMGNQSITLNNQRFCVSCHGVLVEKTKNTDLRDATDFAKNHPQFRPTVIVDSATGQMDRSRAIDETPPPVANTGLIFPHARHLRAGGVRDPVRGNVQLTCEECHKPVGDGHSMTLPTFQETCHQCHQLKFDVHVPARELMHGKPVEVFKQIGDIYDAVAMRGGYEEPEAPAIIRRRPGEVLTEPEKKAASDWAQAKTMEIANGRFGKGLCAACHVLTELPENEAAGGLTWDVKPVLLSNSYLPKASFTHEPHRDVACATCHAETKESMHSSDVLIPSVAVCQSCHGGEESHNRVPSTCVACHRFHRSDLGAMHATKDNDAQTARRLNQRPAETPKSDSP
jgi:predicted CXXCH cytochrome family protein